jgi:hypothetical protein
MTYTCGMTTNWYPELGALASVAGQNVTLVGFAGSSNHQHRNPNCDDPFCPRWDTCTADGQCSTAWGCQIDRPIVEDAAQPTQYSPDFPTEGSRMSFMGIVVQRTRFTYTVTIGTAHPVAFATETDARALARTEARKLVAAHNEQVAQRDAVTVEVAPPPRARARLTRQYGTIKLTARQAGILANVEPGQRYPAGSFRPSVAAGLHDRGLITLAVPRCPGLGGTVTHLGATVASERLRTIRSTV